MSVGKGSVCLGLLCVGCEEWKEKSADRIFLMFRNESLVMK